MAPISDQVMCLRIYCEFISTAQFHENHASGLLYVMNSKCLDWLSNADYLSMELLWTVCYSDNGYGVLGDDGCAWLLLNLALAVAHAAMNGFLPSLVFILQGCD